MSLTIWKFPLSVDDRLAISMPEGAQVLCVQTQYDEPCVWALVDPDKPSAPRNFRIAGTGHPIDADPGRYVGTFQMRHGRYVFHLFEVP